MLKSFNYIINPKTRILVLGTMPGEASLQANEYYAHPRNLFWKIIAEIFNDSKEFCSYKEKLNCLNSNNIGLWDNLQNCERSGSLDSQIKEPRPNDFENLFKRYPQIECLLFNGQQSYKFFNKFHPQLLKTFNYQVLPSTSPANASIPYSFKIEAWRKALHIS